MASTTNRFASQRHHDFRALVSRLVRLIFLLLLGLTAACVKHDRRDGPQTTSAYKAVLDSGVFPDTSTLAADGPGDDNDSFQPDAATEGGPDGPIVVGNPMAEVEGLSHTVIRAIRVTGDEVLVLVDEGVGSGKRFRVERIMLNPRVSVEGWPQYLPEAVVGNWDSVAGIGWNFSKEILWVAANIAKADGTGKKVGRLFAFSGGDLSALPSPDASIFPEQEIADVVVADSYVYGFFLGVNKIVSANMTSLTAGHSWVANAVEATTPADVVLGIDETQVKLVILHSKGVVESDLAGKNVKVRNSWTSPRLPLLQEREKSRAWFRSKTPSVSGGFDLIWHTSTNNWGTISSTELGLTNTGLQAAMFYDVVDLLFVFDSCQRILAVEICPIGFCKQTTIPLASCTLP
jgi:hypothetical protein